MTKTKPLPSYIRNRLSIDDLDSSRGILQIIEHRGSVTQQQVAKEAGLSGGTCNLHFQKLEHMGLIHRADSVRTQSRGRSTIIWEIEQEKNLCLSLVFDVPFFQGTLVDFEGNVLFEKRQDLSGIADGVELIKEVEIFINASIVKAQQLNGASIRQVFVGVPGLFEPRSSVIRIAANFPALNGIDFPQWIGQAFGLPCFCGSLGLAFYYGEAAKLPLGTRTMVVFWDLGVGATAGVGDRLISHSTDTLLSEIGHVRVQRDGPQCHCGKRGCLETFAGGWSIIEALDDPAIGTLDDLRNAVLSGDPKAMEAARNAARLLGSGLCWPLQIVQSERLVVTGPLASIFPVVREAFIEGLSTLFNDAEIAALDPVASDDAQLAMKTGASLFARRLFFHPENPSSSPKPRRS